MPALTTRQKGRATLAKLTKDRDETKARREANAKATKAPVATLNAGTAANTPTMGGSSPALTSQKKEPVGVCLPPCL